MARRLAQQRMTFSDFEYPFRPHRALSLRQLRFLFVFGSLLTSRVLPSANPVPLSLSLTRNILLRQFHAVSSSTVCIVNILKNNVKRFAASHGFSAMGEFFGIITKSVKSTNLLLTTMS